MASPITRAAKTGVKTIRRGGPGRRQHKGRTAGATRATLGSEPASGLETLAERRAQFPKFTVALKADARVFSATRGEPYEFDSTTDLLRQYAHLAWTCDSFLALELCRLRASLLAHHVPVLPRMARRLAWSLARVAIGDAVIVQPGVNIPYGQVVVLGHTEIQADCDLRPWVTIGPEPGDNRGPVLEQGALLGTGSEVLGPFIIGTRSLVGANARVRRDVPPMTTAVGNPVTILPPRGQRRKPGKAEALVAALATDDADLEPEVPPEILATVRPLWSQADTAEREGRYSDAIELFTKANRIHRRNTIDVRLVRLRHQAFVSMDRSPNPIAWPPAFEDPFPGLEGPPIISGADLTVENIGGSIVHHGGLIVRGLIAPDQVERLRDDIDLAFAACDYNRDRGKGARPQRHFAPFNPPPPHAVNVGERGWVRSANGVLTADSPPALFDLIEAFEAAGVPALLEGYLGERPAFSVNKSTLRRSCGADPAWHQDGSFLGPDVRTINIWLSLSHCGGNTDTVGLDIIPRRIDELLPTGTHGAYFPHSIGQGIVDTFTGETPMLTPLFAPGDAMVFDDRFLHRTSMAEGIGAERYAIESWFFAPSGFPTKYSPLLL